MRFIVKVKKDEYSREKNLDQVLSAMLGLNMEIISITEISNKSYIIVETTKSKIDRLYNFCYDYMDEYNRKVVLVELKDKLKNGKIDNREFNKKLNGLFSPIFIEVITPKDMGITLSESRDDKLNDILK